MDIQKLQLKLKKGNPKQRYEAVAELVKLERPEILPVLVEALALEDHEKVLERLNKGIKYLNKKFGSDNSINDVTKDIPLSEIFGSNLTIPKQALDISEASVNKIKQALESGDEASEIKAMRFILNNCATTIVPPGYNIKVDSMMNLILKKFQIQEDDDKVTRDRKRKQLQTFKYKQKQKAVVSEHAKRASDWNDFKTKKASKKKRLDNMSSGVFKKKSMFSGVGDGEKNVSKLTVPKKHQFHSM